MSTIKVDAIESTGGASIIAINQLKGVTAQGSILIVGEGNSNTTNLQQGLCKSWVEIDTATTPASEASCNVASITDSGVGEPNPQMTTALSSAQGVVVANNNESASGFEPNANLTAAGAYRSIMRNSSNTLVDESVSLAVFGSLA